MDADMDIDMDIDLEIPADVEALEAEAMRMEEQAATAAAAAQQAQQDPMESEVAPEKVYIRGLDNLTTADVKRFATEHYSAEHYVRIEWIDDTSANILYDNAESAAEALAAFISPDDSDPTPKPLRKAKKLSTHPDSELEVRPALLTDVKAPRAHEASRFYLLNPDKDPWERRRRQRRGSDDRGEYRRKRYDDREQRRRNEDESFDADMYDDNAAEVRHRRGRRRSFYSENERDTSRRRDTWRPRDEDLLAGRRDAGRLRDRSASPLRDGDGRFGFDEEGPSRRTARQRSATPPRNRRTGDLFSRSNSVKELFPTKAVSVLSSERSAPKELFPEKVTSAPKELFPEKVTTAPKELFPEKLPTSASKRPRELFPHKTAHSNHRRTDAFDAAAEETTDSFRNGTPRVRDLFSRISGGPPATKGRLNGKPDLTEDQGTAIRGIASGMDEDQGHSIRGAAQGFSIKGAAAGGVSVRELFPMKAGASAGGNQGKELFSEKIKGRGGPRRKAEDMFL